MLEGKIFLADTGIPIRSIARKRVLLAVALPEPFTVLKEILKSLIRIYKSLLPIMCDE
jgi:hypothetical protein